MTMLGEMHDYGYTQGLRGPETIFFLTFLIIILILIQLKRSEK